MADPKLDSIRQAADQWTQATEATLAKRPERLEQFQTLSDQDVRRLYTPADVPELDYERDLGFPGQYPFTRGVQDTMYRGRLWTMRQFSGFGSAEETNQRYKYLLANGQTGLSVAFHFPTLKGVNSDHPLSRGEVGKC
ncbi:MAG: methylmalonyl-CoA mutase family protein, partial [Deferrisomatales bacterium]|nr:methylmalonyl-CoA mutase family protein [Deferrisomatales bacterium]